MGPWEAETKEWSRNDGILYLRSVQVGWRKAWKMLRAAAPAWIIAPVRRGKDVPDLTSQHACRCNLLDGDLAPPRSVMYSFGCRRATNNACELPTRRQKSLCSPMAPAEELLLIRRRSCASGSPLLQNKFWHFFFLPFGLKISHCKTWRV